MFGVKERSGGIEKPGMRRGDGGERRIQRGERREKQAQQLAVHELTHFSTLVLQISQLMQSSSGTAGQASDHEATSARPGTGSVDTPPTFLNASAEATCVSSITYGSASRGDRGESSCTPRALRRELQPAHKDPAAPKQ